MLRRAGPPRRRRRARRARRVRGAGQSAPVGLRRRRLSLRERARRRAGGGPVRDPRLLRRRHASRRVLLRAAGSAPGRDVPAGRRPRPVAPRGHRRHLVGVGRQLHGRALRPVRDRGLQAVRGGVSLSQHPGEAHLEGAGAVELVPVDAERLQPDRHGGGAVRRRGLPRRHVRHLARARARPPVRAAQRHRHDGRRALRVHAGPVRPALLRSVPGARGARGGRVVRLSDSPEPDDAPQLPGRPGGPKKPVQQLSPADLARPGAQVCRPAAARWRSPGT